MCVCVCMYILNGGKVCQRENLVSLLQRHIEERKISRSSHPQTKNKYYTVKLERIS